MQLERRAERHGIASRPAKLYIPKVHTKVGLISEGSFTLPIKGAKVLFWVSCFLLLSGNKNFVGQGRDLAIFVGNGSKDKSTSEIEPPL